MARERRARRETLATIGQTARVRLALIANPRSRTAPDPDELAARLRADGAAVSWVPIDAIADEHSGDLAAGALDALGPAALCAARLGVALAVVAAGTANDFARAKELPLDLEQACALARSPLATTVRADLGLAGGRPFVNAAAAGLSVVAANAAKPHKSRLGPIAYAVGAARAGITAAPLRCAVACDGNERFAGRAWQVDVGVTGAFGGGSEIGATRTDDGLLDVAVVPAGSRAGLVRRAFGMRTGRLTEQAGVAHHRAAAIEVAIGGRPAFNVDGETCRCQPARFELHPGGFDLVTPS